LVKRVDHFLFSSTDAARVHVGGALTKTRIGLGKYYESGRHVW
jgi:hypothetical protein